MTIAKQTSSKSTTKNLIMLIKEDHENVKDLFSEFEKLHEKQNNNDKKASIVNEICHKLTLHALAEEKIIYPVAREEINNNDLMDEADVEHAGAKNLIKELSGMDPSDSHYDAKVTVLKEYIEHHVKEEESQMLPKLEKADIDGEELAEKFIKFKEKHESNEKPDKSSHSLKSTKSTQTKPVKN